MRAPLWIVVAAGCSFSPRATGPADAPAAPADADTGVAWWDTDFSLRVPITITNGSSASLPIDFQIGFPYDLAAAPCASSVPHDDVRIVYAAGSGSGQTELTRVIDAVVPPDWTWFRLGAPLAGGASSTNEYWLYCGNGSASPAPADPTLVFDFYDDFDTIDSTVWQTNGTVSAMGGKLVAAATPSSITGDNGVVSKTVMPAAAHAVDFSAQGPATNAFWWGGFQDGTSDVRPWLLWYTDIRTSRITPSFVNGALDPIFEGSADTLDTDFHLYGIEDYGQTAMFRHGDQPYQAIRFADDTGSPAPTMFSLRLWNNTIDSALSVDWIRTRQAIDPPPAATAGSAETQR